MSLIWRNPSEGMNVHLNLCVTLLNREYFGDNKSFVIKRALFNSEHVTNGNSSLIKVADLLTHRPRYTDANGEFQVSDISRFKIRGCKIQDVSTSISIDFPNP